MHLALLPYPHPVPRHELRQPFFCDKAYALHGDRAESSFSIQCCNLNEEGLENCRKVRLLLILSEVERHRQRKKDSSD